MFKSIFLNTYIFIFFFPVVKWKVTINQLIEMDFKFSSILFVFWFTNGLPMQVELYGTIYKFLINLFYIKLNFYSRKVYI